MSPSDSPPILIATRGSDLALVQARAVQAQCQAGFPGRAFELSIIKTTGDKLQTASLASQELPKGLFTKELETALLNGEAALAVHSLKDLPTELPLGLTLGAVGERADVRDVLIHKGTPGAFHSIASLPPHATIATSSTRREAQLRQHRPDLEIVPIRGNVPTRLRKLAEQPGLFGTVLAAAGLHRLAYRIEAGGTLTSQNLPLPPGLFAFPIPLDEMLPCVGQAAIGIETREADPEAAALCQALTHQETLTCVTAERAFLQAMGGGCQLAVAAHASLNGTSLSMRSVTFVSGKPVTGTLTAPASNPTGLGQALALQLSSGNPARP